MELLICVGIGLMGGVCIGFVLGVNSPKRCEPCLANTTNRYRAGYEAGWKDGVGCLHSWIKFKAIAAKNTWTITKADLQKATEDVA